MMTSLAELDPGLWLAVAALCAATIVGLVTGMMIGRWLYREDESVRAALLLRQVMRLRRKLAVADGRAAQMVQQRDRLRRDMRPATAGDPGRTTDRIKRQYTLHNPFQP